MFLESERTDLSCIHDLISIDTRLHWSISENSNLKKKSESNNFKLCPKLIKTGHGSPKCLKKHHIRNYLNNYLPSNKNLKCLQFMASLNEIKDYPDNNDNDDDNDQLIRNEIKQDLVDQFLDEVFSFSKERNACANSTIFKQYFEKLLNKNNKHDLSCIREFLIITTDSKRVIDQFYSAIFDFSNY